ncbi:peptidoglycan-binding domain-containing protein [Streptomyces sp. NPDC002588]|uniref:peptidoglycan-binding domain-containing protein n=1 Tax=Streptomyces sp. NPDC002588 TaxID=3154419 RepID=UPI00331DA50F
MSDPTGLVCPECGTPRAADGTPACSCGRRASDAHLEARAAETAAAEDFDPLRIRPFVEVGDAPRASGEPEEIPPPAAEEPPAPPEPLEPLEPSEPSEPSEPPEPPEPVAEAVGNGRRRPRRVVLTVGVAATAAVVATGGLIAVLFTYRSPARDGDGPEDVRASVPAGATGTGAPSATPSPTVSSARTSSTPSSSPSATPSESRTAPTGTPTPTPSSTGATATAVPAPTLSEGPAPVLRFGDTGPEVVELQLRLKQAGFYEGDADGDFDREVESAVRSYQLARFVLADEPGVYGAATRKSLESETSEP